MKPKGIKVVTESAEKDVVFLTEVDPLFVSLVKHGANQQPFRVIKEDMTVADLQENGGYLNPEQKKKKKKREEDEGAAEKKVTYEPPEAGKDAPEGVRAILRGAYQSCREANPGEDPEKKSMCSRIAWAAVHKKYHRNEKGEWVKNKEKEAEKSWRQIALELLHVDKGGPGSGDVAGHEFHGNQFSEGGGGGKGTVSRREQAARTHGEAAAQAAGGKLGRTIAQEEYGEYRFELRGAGNLDSIGKGLVKNGWEQRDKQNYTKGKRELFVTRDGKQITIKGDVAKEGGEDKVGMIIQSILLPRGLSLDALVAEKGMEWLSDASGDKKQEFDKYMRLDQLPVEKFDKDSLTLTKIHDRGAWVVAGKLLDAESVEGALTLGADVVEKSFLTSPMDQPVEQVEIPSASVSFREVFEKEMHSFLEVVMGTMGQSGINAKARKSTIMGAYEAFGSFLSMSLDAVGEKSVEIEAFLYVDKKGKEGEKKCTHLNEDKSFKGGFEGCVEHFMDCKGLPEENARKMCAYINKRKQGAKEEGGDDMELFKTKEEFVTAVKESFDAFMQEYEAKKAEAAKKLADEEAAKKLAADEEERKKKEAAAAQADKASPEIAELKVAVAEIGKAVKEIAEKTEKLGGQLSTDPAALAGDDEKAKEKETKKSVFAGLFVKTPK